MRKYRTAALMTAALMLLPSCSGRLVPPVDGSENRETSGVTYGMSDTGKLPHDEKAEVISVDFSEKDYGKIPYLKKFDMFASTWAWCNDFSGYPQSDLTNLSRIPAVAELLPETVRTDLFMGYWGIGREIGKGDGQDGTTDGEYRLVKNLTDALLSGGLNAEFIYFASPVMTGGGISGDAWKSVKDGAGWRLLCRNVSAYFREHGMGVRRHEIWNEPDYYITDPEKDGVYFLGSWDDYINVYINGAKGIREGDPDAETGGVSAAWMNRISKNGELDRFLQKTLAEGVLPDYVSWHFYGSNGGMKMLEDYISGARECLEKSEAYDTVWQNLNEFNVSLDRKVTSGYSMVRLTLDAYQRLLYATDIARVAWTSALDRNLEGSDGQALIDPKTGERTPAYYTQWMYARLPVQPVMTSEMSGVGVMASAESGRAAVLAYDSAISARTVTFDMKNIGFDRADITVYAVGREHIQNRISSNSPVKLAEYRNVAVSGDVKYTVTVPENGAVLILADSCGGDVPHEKISPLADCVVRTDYWYNGRDDGGAHAWVSTKSFVASLGSGNSGRSRGTACAVTLDGMENEKLTVTASHSDGIAGTGAVCGIMTVYRVNGEYARTVYHGFEGAEGKLAVPLGTGREYDEFSVLPSGESIIDLRAEAPEGWDGRIQLIFVINGAEKNSGAEFVVGLQ